MKFFEHDLQIDPSSKRRWGKRIGEAGTEKLLVEFAFDNTTTVNSGIMIAGTGARWMGGAWNVYAQEAAGDTDYHPKKLEVGLFF